MIQHAADFSSLFLCKMNEQYLWKAVFSVFFFLSSFKIIAQNYFQPVAAPQLGLSAYSQYQQDVFSSVHQQAALAKINKPAIGLYGENRFMLSENGAYTLGVAMPSAAGNFAVHLLYQGFYLFNVRQVGLAYARSLGKQVDIGIRFNYIGCSLSAMRPILNVEGGLLFHLTEKFSAGIHLYNPVGSMLSKGSLKINPVYKIGLGWDASENFYLAAEIIKEQSMNTNFVGGFLYHFQKQFFLKAGITTAQSNNYIGAGFACKQYRIDITASHHAQLGWSPGLMLIMEFKK